MTVLSKFIIRFPYNHPYYHDSISESTLSTVYKDPENLLYYPGQIHILSKINSLVDPLYIRKKMTLVAIIYLSGSTVASYAGKKSQVLFGQNEIA
jgi:hypothetical protein